MTCFATNSPAEDFLSAEIAIGKGHFGEARILMAALDGYPLLPYLELALAQKRLASLSDAEVAALLRRHLGVPTSRKLRRKWIGRLASEGRWELIPAHYVDDGHTESACLEAEALWRTGHEAQAWPRVAAVWPTGKSLPDVCDPVLAAWREAGQLTPALAWTRARLAVERGNLRLARYLVRFLSTEHRQLLERWMELRSNPSGLSAFARAGNLDSLDRRHVLVQIFTRTVRRDLDSGLRIWRSLEKITLPETLREELEERVGIALARSGDPRAVDWLSGVRTVDGLVARAVSAIRQQRWLEVNATLAAMPPEEAGRERWRYWAARALQLRGEPGARQHFMELAGERSYYGFLAADRVGAPYALSHAAIQVQPATLEAVSARPASLRAREWWSLGRSEEGRREWRQLLNALDRQETLAATLLAHRWGWHSAAIIGAASAAYWSDLDVRFPAPHGTQVRAAAMTSGLRASRIYAVARQESAFMDDIQSRAGALGLMQLLPATARQVARRARLPRPSHQSLLDPATNVTLGSLYLARLEDRYAGHPVLATSAYNAGPGRVARWRPRAEQVNSEIWIESIPFRETRRYVRRVLTYQVIYANRLGENAVRLKDLMPAVTPG